MTKPIGPICNLDCKYCFYLEKEALYPSGEKWRMSDQVLEQYVKQYIAHQDAQEITFAWQGGEPTLLGVDFFRKAVALQKQYGQGRNIANALQTNGTLLDDEWCQFFKEEKFLIGLSIDGPRHLHDHYRVDKQQKPTFDSVMAGINLLKKHGVDFNTLTVVNRANAAQPLAVYRFLREIGSGYIQFIPLVERVAPAQLTVEGYDLAHPPEMGSAQAASPVTDWSVPSVQFGRFLIDIFDEWVRRDVGKVFVQHFDVALGIWMGLGSTLCVFAEKCGSALAMEHNGDLYSCDHYVYPRYKLGNLLDKSLGEMVRSPQQLKFGSDKFDTLPQYCRKCEVRFACNGECPKHRFLRTPDGEEGLNYLCGGYRPFFNHIHPHMQLMAKLVHSGKPAAQIMDIIRQQQQQLRQQAQPNSACPCGSGKKYKKCCGAPKATGRPTPRRR